MTFSVSTGLCRISEDRLVITDANGLCLLLLSNPRTQILCDRVWFEPNVPEKDAVL